MRNAVVDGVSRFVQKSFHRTKIISCGTDYSRTIHGGFDHKSKLEGVRLRNDPVIVCNRMPQLPKSAHRSVAPLLDFRLLVSFFRENIEVVVVISNGKNLAESAVYFVTVKPRNGLAHCFAEGARLEVCREITSFLREHVQTIVEHAERKMIHTDGSQLLEKPLECRTKAQKDHLVCARHVSVIGSPIDVRAVEVSFQVQHQIPGIRGCSSEMLNGDFRDGREITGMCRNIGDSLLSKSIESRPCHEGVIGLMSRRCCYCYFALTPGLPLTTNPDHRQVNFPSPTETSDFPHRPFRPNDSGRWP
ncbi:MAG: hypothetical protein PCFJNLEI_01176 [Verrucomicrobiae bacterium]|nr:hypothetical protein [Verrucomicrobiae bacterium]